jgi:ribonuclease HI
LLLFHSENYFQSINEIKSQINYLKEQGVVVSFNWTPGHAIIKGNEIADQQDCRNTSRLLIRLPNWMADYLANPE